MRGKEEKEVQSPRAGVGLTVGLPKLITERCFAGMTNYCFRKLTYSVGCSDGCRNSCGSPGIGEPMLHLTPANTNHLYRDP